MERKNADRPRKVAIYTLGCKVNQSESAALGELLRNAGYEIVPPEANADIYVVNSCTVTTEGGAKSRRWLRHAKRGNPAAVTVLTGCHPQAFPQEALEVGADILSGAAARGRLPQLLEEYFRTGRPVVDIVPQTDTFEELPPAKTAGRTRAFIKVQDGCNRRCAYCVIPAARGPSRSRKEQDILQEVRLHVAQGAREVVLTGINLSSYGRDTASNLAALVEALAGVEGLSRIRLSSLDPDLLQKQEILRFAGVPQLCPQFHLSLQSGCTETLRRMRRPYTPQDYREAAENLRAALPGATFTTDVIVGFPGETEQDFRESMQFVREMRFLKVHVFPFSKRDGTPAATFDGQLPKGEKQRRAREMQAVADEGRAELLRACRGKTAEVLLEKPLSDGLFTGYTQHYVPVLCETNEKKQGDVVAVRLGSFDGERVRAVLL